MKKRLSEYFGLNRRYSRSINVEQDLEETLMQSITLRSHVGEDGILQLSVPVGMTDVDLEVMVIVQPITKAESANTPEELGWPPGFFERTFGSLRDEPFEREPQGELQEREPLE